MLLFTAPRDALLAPLQSVSGIVEKRHTLPILSNVLIEKKGDALTLLATDIEIQIRNRTTAALGADDVAITVGARKLQDILRALPDTADVSLTLDDKRITLKAGKSRFQLQTLPAADYPRLAPPEGEGVHFTTTQRPSRSSSPRCSTRWPSRTSATTSTACCWSWPATCCAWSPPTATAWPTPPPRWWATTPAPT
jgi:hypothetical protein